MDSYFQIILASLILITSFFFGILSKKTSIPSVLMLIVLGIGLKIGLDSANIVLGDFSEPLKMLGTIGLIMIVLEAALELKLDKNKVWPITKAFLIALVGLIASTWITAIVLHELIAGMDMQAAWIYATPLSILSSAIIIPSVSALRKDKKEFHIYESTFSDILGIMLFFYLTSQIVTDAHSSGSGIGTFGVETIVTIIVSFLISYIIILVFQKIKSHVKLFLLIAVLLLLYAIGKTMHLSSLIIILIFGLVIANMDVFFFGWIRKFLDIKKAQHIYEELLTITIESAFVVRTFFFVIFGITISLSSLADWNVVMVSIVLLAIIYIIRFVLLKASIGKDILPQLYIAPRGLITILLFNDIPDGVKVAEFSDGILLFVIIGSSLIMTFAMIWAKKRSNTAIEQSKANPVRTIGWKAPGIE